MRMLTVEKRKAEAEGLRVLDTFRVILHRKTVSEMESSEGEAGLSQATVRRCSEELAVGFGRSAFEGDYGCVSIAGSS